MAGYGDPPIGSSRDMTNTAISGKKTVQATSITKSVDYVATGTSSNLVLSLSATASDTATSYPIPRSVNISNSGIVPIVAMIGYESYSDEDTDAGTKYIHCFLRPGESITPPLIGLIPTANDLQVLDGEVVDFTAPNTALKVDTGDATASGELANTTDPVTFEIDNGHEKYRVGDYIRVENEILRVEGTYDDNPVTDLNGNTLPAIADNHIACSRGHFGSDAASHSGAADIYFAHFNEYHDYDRILSGNTQLVQTDPLGRFKASNFFGYGRGTGDIGGTSKPVGLVPGSIVFRWYSKAYQDVYMGGTGASGGLGTASLPITASTNSKLSASTAYEFNITIDDSAATAISFTTDSSNLNFGGTNGIVRKMQDAIDTATRTPGNALFGYSCSISIVNGALRFTSNSRLYAHDTTNGSKLLLADTTGGGTNVFSGAAGIFPDINGVNAPVTPKLPSLKVYDPITYATSFNTDSQRICYDDGYGNIIGCSRGTINYETGAINLVGAPANASFEVSLIHDSPFSGSINATKADSNTIAAIHANVLNKNAQGKITVRLNPR